MCSRGVAALCITGGLAVLMSIQHYASSPPRKRQFRGEAHQQVEVDSSLQILRALAPVLRTGRRAVKVRLAADDATVPAGAKKVHFIRHGEGFHNVAQREWRERPDYDGKSEPYTLDNDPSGRYTDALLTQAGVSQARALQTRTQALAPQLLVVSPLRRATQTGLLAFEPHVTSGRLPVLAHELAHERGGRHTCDKRLSRTALAAAYPKVSYALLESEEDPLWGDGVTRESWEALARRGVGFVDWLLARPETHVAVAAHSAFLLALFNAALEAQEDADEEDADEVGVRAWFGTGEMRTVLLTPS